MNKDINLQGVIGITFVCTSFKKTVKYIRSHWNLIGRLRMARHWQYMAKKYDIKHDKLYSHVNVVYGKKYLFRVGLTMLNPWYFFIKGYMYYPIYVEKHRVSDIVYQSDVVGGFGSPHRTEYSELKTLEQIATLIENFDINNYSTK